MTEHFRPAAAASDLGSPRLRASSDLVTAKILAVDDDRATSSPSRRCCARPGIEIVTADSGEAALAPRPEGRFRRHPARRADAAAWTATRWRR